MMVDQLNAFASEVTRVAREVGTEGKLGGQAEVKGVGRHLEGPDRQRQPAGRQPHRAAARHVARRDGDRQRRPDAEDHRRSPRRDPADQGRHQQDGRSARVVRLGSDARRREVGTEGKLGGQADVRGVAGTWKDLTDNVNAMASNLTGQVRNIAEVTTAVANGDLSKKITVDVRGEILELKNTINTMVDQLERVRLGSHARRARGRHRRQARRPGRGRRASPAPGRTSPTTSTSWPAT